MFHGMVPQLRAREGDIRAVTAWVADVLMLLLNVTLQAFLCQQTQTTLLTDEWFVSWKKKPYNVI